MHTKFKYPTHQISVGSEQKKLTLGTAALGGVWGDVNETESVDTILLALESNIRVLDTAPAYNRGEEFLGKALKQWHGERPVVSSKIGRLHGEKAEVGYYDYSVGALRKSIANSLELLGLDYLDVAFLHDMENCPRELRLPAIECMQQMKQEGLIKNVGLGGKMDNHWYTLANKEHIDVVMTYNRLNACNIDGMLFDVPLYKQEGIMIYSASILHMGLLGRRHDEILQNQPGWIQDKDVRNAVNAKRIAERNGMSLSTLAHRFAFSIAEVDRVVIGARNKAQLQDTLQDWQSAVLPKELFEEVAHNIL